MVEAIAAAPTSAGLFCDFDGVLADITARPDAAVPRAGLPEVLVTLSGRLGRVAVISGRPVDYLSRFLPPAVDLVGLYGLERRLAGVVSTLPGVERWREPVARLAEVARADFGADAVEPKGVSLTLHYRSDPGLTEAIGQWAARAADESGLELRPAKQSFELHPPLRHDKGSSLLELAEALDPVCYLGDDIGDLPAFDALEELAARRVTTFRVAVDSSEMPPTLGSRADLVIPGPAGVEALLRSLLEAVEAAT